MATYALCDNVVTITPAKNGFIVNGPSGHYVFTSLKQVLKFITDWEASLKEGE